MNCTFTFANKIWPFFSMFSFKLLNRTGLGAEYLDYCNQSFCYESRQVCNQTMDHDDITKRLTIGGLQRYSTFETEKKRTTPLLNEDCNDAGAPISESIGRKASAPTD